MVVVEEIDDRDKVSLGLAESVDRDEAGVEEAEAAAEPKPEPKRQPRDTREPEKVGASRSSGKPERTVVSFEDEFEAGL